MSYVLNNNLVYNTKAPFTKLHRSLVTTFSSLYLKIVGLTSKNFANPLKWITLLTKKLV